jgi:hypothetical protein
VEWLLYVTVATVVVDGIFGLDIFLTGSDRLSLIYRSAFLIKVVLVIFSICFFSKIPKSIGLLCLILVLAAKFLLGIYFGGAVKSFVGHVNFYSLIILGYIAGWQLARSDLTKIKFNIKFFKVATWLTLVICIIYFTAYQLGYIIYFGMGIQTYILVSVYLATRSSKLYAPILFLTIILTGKRSSFLIYLVQLFGPKIVARRFSFKGIITGLLVFSLFLYVSYQVGLMARFQLLVDLALGFDKDDMDKSRHLFYLATSGRSEEIYAYFIDQSHSLSVLLFGQLAGYSFVITDLAGNDYQHYYFHISPLNFIFHFGIPVGILIIFHQFRLLIWALRYGSRESNIFCLLYVGFYLTSLFGASVIVDVSFWVLYSYCHFLRQFNSKGRRTESLNYDGDILLNER